jgi:hypothetical protein
MYQCLTHTTAQCRGQAPSVCPTHGAAADACHSSNPIAPATRMNVPLMMSLWSKLLVNSTLNIKPITISCQPTTKPQLPVHYAKCPVHLTPK